MTNWFIIGLNISAFASCIYIIYILFTKNKKIVELEKNIAFYSNELDQLTDTKIRSLDGIFEIHVTVDPEDNFVKLLSYINNHEKDRHMKAIYAVSKDKVNQYMLSHFTRKTNEKEAINSAMLMAKEIEAFGIKVVRTKVEGHGAKGTPMTKADYQRFTEYLTEQYNTSKPYFEFHVKVSGHAQIFDFEKLELDVSQMKGVAISYNLCSRNRKPLLTIRVYDEGFILAHKYKDEVLNKLKEVGYIFENGLQQEFSIYDTYQALDAGWLIHA